MQDGITELSSDGPKSIECSDVECGPQLVIDAVDSFNYAAWQNSVPLLRNLTIENSNGPELSSLTIELAASPAFAREKRWTIDRVAGGTNLMIKDTDLDIDPTYLDRLDEAERGVLNFKLFQKGNLLAESRHVLRVLARDEWGGMSTMGELLSAFVTPNDPALATLLKSAATVLEKHGHPSALDGYQSEDPNRAFLLTAALWSAVCARSLTYANPPGSFERVGQKTRRVNAVLSDGLATCLDTSLLFCSGLEAIGLNPVIVMTQGHCFAGVWLVPKKMFKRPVEVDCTEVRKAIAAKELIVFETTLVTNRPARQFDGAVAVATAAVSVERDHEFVAVVDVARGRMSQILPLASHAQRKESDTQVESDEPPLPASPGYDAAPAQEVEERPTTAAGRIERWQRKLLDLSLRNRLLNFRASKQCVPVLCPDVSRLEDRLADGKRLRLFSLPDGNPLGLRDAELHQKRTQKDLDIEFAKRALDKDEVVCPVEQRELDSRLTALFRKVRNDLAEGGSNTLYLAVGFLRWKQNPADDKAYRAPLLLVPVSLIRRSASAPFYLGSHEDDVRFNATLLQFLKKDFDCDLTFLESELPTDDSGVNVPLVLERVRHAVRDIPGFEVVEEAAIAPFSFAKYLMWRDLVDRVGQLERNRVVRHLIHEPDKAYSVEGAGPMPRPYEIDTRYLPHELVHPLPADSSQLAAVMAASEGHDLVIVGPPGTGKSQTIANLITQCLAVGKTVLFVAEKTAALDVVHRRLREHGLGDCCVELHSNKAQKRHFFDQLEASWKNRIAAESNDWPKICEELRIRRDQLNAYVAALHTEETNGWTAFLAMGEYVAGRDIPAPRLSWSKMTWHTREQYAEFEKTIAQLASLFRAIPTDAMLPRVEATDWSMGWETSLLDCCQDLEAVGDALISAIKALSKLSAIPHLEDVSSSQLTTLYRFAQALMRPELPSAELLLNDRLGDLTHLLGDRQTLLEQSRQANNALEAAVCGLSTALGASVTSPIDEAQRRAIYRVANELIRPNLPPSEIVFHPNLDGLNEALANRPALLQSRASAFESLLARSYSSALLERVPLELLERRWASACKSLWPLSAWAKREIRKKLQAYMNPGSSADPEIDLPLLREYREACARVTENLGTLGLPPHLRDSVDNDPTALDGALQSARKLREVFGAAGAAIANVAVASRCELEPLIDAARRLYPPGKMVESLRQKLKENLVATQLSPELSAVIANDASAISGQIQLASNIRDTARSLGVTAEQLPEVVSATLNASPHLRCSVATDCCRAAKKFQEVWASYGRIAGDLPAPIDSIAIVSDAALQARKVVTHRSGLKQWTAWVRTRQLAEKLGLSSFTNAIQSGEVPAADAVSRFRLAYARWWIPNLVDRSDSLRTFQKFLHEITIEEFYQLDDKARLAAAPRARQRMLHGLPPSDKVPRQSELGLLRHQISLKRPSKSIREVITGMPKTFGKLAPCLLMSPLSIAQYLPANHEQFDVVVFDEASQIATWDAIGAIARGKQTIIVGDPKQLPPTNFFGKAENDEDNDELQDHEKDLESILDEAQASGLPTLQLNWHYRSRHESLIAFSNWNYYGNRLVTFPAAESEDRGVAFRYVQDGFYDRGKSRTNRTEGESIVKDLVERMKRCLGKANSERLTYGVVTFNSQQQELIQDLLDEALRQSPELEWFFSDERIEPTVVKNLENVQGDERDVMMFSITFGFDAAGKFPVDFGAINRNGGERRLNVAVTRARQQLLVYSSFLPDQLRAERSTARGVHDLKAFLEYADKGPQAIIARTDGSIGGYESPLEEAVATTLQQRGWRIDTQVGVSGFRIDLGIVHPDKPGVYLAGVECDGATYHRSVVARDRDKIRQQVLENLGWTILRVWSVDWWYDAQSAIDQLDNKLRELLQRGREKIPPPELPGMSKQLDPLVNHLGPEGEEFAQRLPAGTTPESSSPKNVSQ